MPRFKLVVFDFDGTLADSAPWFRTVFNDFARKHGFRTVDEAEIERLRGRSSRQIIADLGVPFWKLPLIAADMRRSSAAAADEIPLFTGVPAMLAGLRDQGSRLAVVSSNGEDVVRRVLGPCADHISEFACGVSLFGKAPALERLKRRLGLGGAEILCIGDEVRDIEAGRRAGLVCGGVLWGYANAAALSAAAPDFLFQTLDEVAAAQAAV